MSDAVTPHRHFLLYKPFGYLCQFGSGARAERNKKFLGALSNHQQKPSFQARLTEAMKNAQQQAAEQKALGQGKGKK